MKRYLSFMLMLAMLLSLTPISKAASGDQTYFAADPQDTNRYKTSVIDLCGDGDTLYVLVDGKVCTLKKGEEPKVLIDNVITNRTYYEMTQEERAGQPVFSAVFAEDGKLTVLDGVVGAVTQVESIADGKAVYGETVMLEMDARVEEEGMDTYLNFQFESSAISGNTLLVTGYDWESGTGDLQTFAFDVTTGEAKDVSIERVQQLCTYKDGKFLCVVAEHENMYDSETRSYRPWSLCVYDPVTDTSETIAQVSEVVYYNVRGLAYNESTDTLYFGTTNKIYRMVNLKNAELAAYHPATNLWAEGKVLAAFGDQAAVFDEYGLYVRTPDPAQLPKATLSVYGYYATSEHMQAIAALGDIPVFFNESTYYNSAQELGQALSGGEDQLDILSVSMSWIDFTRLMEKGYCYDLSGSEEIASFLDELYPFLKDGVMYNGKIMALPYEMYGAQWVYNPEAFEELGLSVPTTYAELIDFINEWAKEENSENWEKYTVFSDEGSYKEQVFYSFFENYEQYMLSSDETLSLDNSTFREVMTKLGTLDAENVEVYVDWSLYGDEVPEEVEELWNKTGLMSSYYSASIYGHGDYEPMQMKISADSEYMMPMQVSVLFVNPRSKNIDAAVQYLEELCKALRKNQEQMTFLSPLYNEPILNPYYEENLGYMQEALVRMEEELANADPIDKPMLQENLDTYRESVENYTVTGRYNVSAESIAAYRKEMEHAVLSLPSVMNNGDDDSFFTLRQRYLDGQVTLEQFITEGSGKLRLMQLENQ